MRRTMPRRQVCSGEKANIGSETHGLRKREVK